MSKFENNKFIGKERVKIQLCIWPKEGNLLKLQFKAKDVKKRKVMVANFIKQIPKEDLG